MKQAWVDSVSKVVGEKGDLSYGELTENCGLSPYQVKCLQKEGYLVKAKWGVYSFSVNPHSEPKQKSVEKSVSEMKNPAPVGGSTGFVVEQSKIVRQLIRSELGQAKSDQRKMIEKRKELDGQLDNVPYKVKTTIQNDINALTVGIHGQWSYILALEAELKRHSVTT